MARLGLTLDAAVQIKIAVLADDPDERHVITVQHEDFLGVTRGQPRLTALLDRDLSTHHVSSLATIPKQVSNRSATSSSHAPSQNTRT